MITSWVERLREEEEEVSMREEEEMSMGEEQEEDEHVLPRGRREQNCRRWLQACMQTKCQAVSLRGPNTSSKRAEALCRSQQKTPLKGIHPYHCLEKVASVYRQ